MVPRGNPAGISSVADLGREDVRISQPDPDNENIGEHIIKRGVRHTGPTIPWLFLPLEHSGGCTKPDKPFDDF
ncbi:MAG: hypothetical protein IBX61_07485 [Thermoleophilia bacterium]|nr:hypothetical protein [Thermoleophilia bacterium]